MSNVRSDCMVLEVGLDVPSTRTSEGAGAPASRVYPSTRIDSGAGRTYAGATITGGRRKVDEDGWAGRPDLGVFLVADGRGRASGRAAASYALTTIERTLPAPLAATGGMDPLAGALAETSARIAASLVALRLLGGWVVTASVGDCRVYRLRRGGETSARGPDSRARRGVLTRRTTATMQPVGAGADVDIHVEYSAYSPGDLFLLCTDSVTADLDDATLRNLLAVDDDALDARCERLLHATAQHGGARDATALIVQL